ncbi:MAG: class I SAM-dependent methyltransferase [Planctomycetaceae bacterium]|nr:class I SAM-dependent methyltransferase [Planctomycetaceae bacterium]MCB9926203.1 class I SAM-dependent methyltransferase [Planctomycetaceae bacterium]
MDDDNSILEQIKKLLQESHQRQLAAQYRDFRQMEALLSLHSAIDFRSVLPPTRVWSVSPDFAVILVEVIQDHRPKTIVDLGGGFTAIVAGYCVEKFGDGTVIAVDHQREFADATRRSINRHDLDSVVRIRHALLTPVTIDHTNWDWYDLATFNDVHDIDLLIVDGPAQHGSNREMVRFPALPLLMSKLSPGAHILVDDANRDHEQRIIDRWMKEFPIRLVNRFLTEKGMVVLQYDGQHAQ